MSMKVSFIFTWLMKPPLMPQVSSVSWSPALIWRPSVKLTGRWERLSLSVLYSARESTCVCRARTLREVHSLTDTTYYTTRYAYTTDTCTPYYWYMYTILLIHVHRTTDTCTPYYWYMYTILLIHVHRTTDTCTLYYWYMYTILLIHVYYTTDTCTPYYWYMYTILLTCTLYYIFL